MTDRPRLLICDDSATILKSISILLAPKYELLTVPSAEEALRRANAFGPDLIISDLIMEGMSGYELCRRVREEPVLKGVPLILLTSKTDDDARALGLEVGADDYLFKPIRSRELLARVGSLVRLRYATQSLERRTHELEQTNLALQKAQNLMVEQEKLASLGQLVAGIAHELNNPINYCYGNAQFLKSYAETLLGLIDRFDGLPELTEPQRQSIDLGKKAADIDFVRADLMKVIASIQLGTSRAAEIVKDLLAFARIGSGKLEEVNLHDTVEMALTVLSHEFRDRIEIVKELAPLPRILADASKLGQVFVNLLMNASQAITGKGQITICVLEEQGFARCSIRDSGSGMTAEIRAKIFDPFFSTKPVGKGTGLGLSISYGIVQQHGGRIEVESEPQVGSTFTVFLPMPPK